MPNPAYILVEYRGGVPCTRRAAGTTGSSPSSLTAARGRERRRPRSRQVDQGLLPMSSVGTKAAARVDKLDAMHGNWLRKAGAQLHQAARFAAIGRQVGAEEEEIGITAAAPLAAGETVVAVPSKVLLNPSVVAASAAGARILAAAGAAHLPKPSSGAIFTIRYCIGLVDPADEYYWYFRSLPTHDPTTLSWPGTVRERLTRTSLGNATDRAEMLLHASTDELALAVVAAGLCPSHAVSWERRCWARGMFESRKFLFTEISGQSLVHPDLAATDQPAATEGWALPMIDVANHSRDANCKLQISAEGASLVTAHPIDRGEELTLDYGNRGNESLLFAYGFAVQDNPDDFYPVTLTAPPPLVLRASTEGAEATAGPSMAAGQKAIVAGSLHEQEQEEQRTLQALRMHILSAASLPYEVHHDQSITIGPLPLLGRQHNDPDSDNEQEALLVKKSVSGQQQHILGEKDEDDDEDEEQDEQEAVVRQQQDADANYNAHEEEEDDGSSWASNNASGGLPFVLAALGVIGLRDADDEPGLTSVQLQALHTQLKAALEQLLVLDCSSKLDHARRDVEQNSVQPRPAKRHRTTPSGLVTTQIFIQELLSRVRWYQEGQVKALRHACSSVLKLYERVRIGELELEELAESDEIEHSEEDNREEDGDTRKGSET